MTYTDYLRAAIVTLPVYERQSAKLLTSDEKIELETHLSEAPEAHPIVPGTGGVRKALWGRAGTGKRGGVRAIYYYHFSNHAVFMMALYAKNQKTDLTEQDKKDLKEVVNRIKGRHLQ